MDDHDDGDNDGDDHHDEDDHGHDDDDSDNDNDGKYAALTVCVGVFGVDAILAVTAATITSLFF